MHAADIAIYPYEKTLTTGSLMLALGYGLPCVGMTREDLERWNAGVL